MPASIHPGLWEIISMFGHHPRVPSNQMITRLFFFFFSPPEVIDKFNGSGP